MNKEELFDKKTLDQLKKNGIDLRVAELKGGTAHNAIPRDAEATIFIPEADLAKAKSTRA